MFIALTMCQALFYNAQNRNKNWNGPGGSDLSDVFKCCV